MGSCISKCCPKSPNSSLKRCNPIVQDKLVLVGNNATSTTSVTSSTLSTPTSASLPLFKKSSVAPYCSPSSSPCTTTFTTSSCSLSSKSPPSSLSSPSLLLSSSSVSKDRFSGFSNEFLWSCARENPHVISVSNDLVVKGSGGCSSSSSIHGKSTALVPPNCPGTTPLKPSAAAPKARVALNDQSVNASRTPQKRARATSPALTRQKSLRRDYNATERELISSTASALHRRNLVSLSPTPSRRYSGEEAIRGITKNAVQGRRDHGCSHTADIMSLKRKVMSSTNSNTNCQFSSERSYKERNLPQPASTEMLARRINESDIIRDSSVSKRVETCTHHVNYGVQKISVGARHDQVEGLSSLLVNDIDNPLISLDCFIFL